MWVPDISNIGGPRYLALASAIAEAIDSGELVAGTQLPPQRDLSGKLGVTVGTVGRAYMLAKKRELVSGEVGRGTFVRPHDEKDTFANYLPERKPGTVDLACFRIPVNELADTLARVITGVADHAVLLPLIGYPPAAGYITHRTAGAAWIKRSGLKIPPEQVIVCSGGQHGLLAAIMTLANLPGPILSGRITYSGLKSIASLREIELEGVEMDSEGMIPEALAAAAEKTGGRVAYLQPTVHNPVGCVMSDKRRKKIAEVARIHDLILIEDDVAAAGLSDRGLPLAAYAPERTIYISSLSKCVSPALRVGFIGAPASFIEALSNTIHSLSLATSPLVMEAASLMIMDGTAGRIADRNNQELARRHELVRQELSGLDVNSNPAAFFAWLRLPDHWSSSEFADAVQKAGVSVVRSSNFMVGSDEVGNAVRISLNPQTNLGVLIDGLRIVRKIAMERPGPQLAII
ncbi:PLP-dependent aminotransferase family protein [Sneathiella sp.]|uniref:aminotransferase-like domain-containing protein n=1 Tax=Sneathiella sp. TaxID=1964365 RepID=UPI003566C8D7